VLEEKLKNFDPKVNGESLGGLARGYQESLLVYNAYKIGIFEVLGNNAKDIASIAQELGCLPERLGYLLNVLVPMGLIEKRDGRYCNSSIVQTFLLSNSRFYQGDLLELQLSPKRRQQWDRIDEWLRGESSGTVRKSEPDEVFNPSFIRAMAQGALSNEAFKETIIQIANHQCFQAARRLLDLGGGHGLYAIALKQIRPELDVVVYDLPHVGQVAEEYSRQYDTEVSFVPGNFYKDDLPMKQDIILAFDILYPAPGPQKKMVIEKMYNALNPEGYLLLKQLFLDDTRTKPKGAAFFSLCLSLGNFMSHVSTVQEAEEMFNDTGFQIVDSCKVGGSTSTLLFLKKSG
jgi:hypothetical protein